MDEIRIAVVGLGSRGVGWVRRLAGTTGYRVVALCDHIAPLEAGARAALAGALAGREGAAGVPFSTRYEDVLADGGVDAVALTVRCAEQGALAAQGLEAGKHVCAEVPAAHTVEDCWRLVTAAERSGKVYLLAEQTRYWGFVRAWRDLVAQGQLGHVTLVEGQYFHYYVEKHFQDPAGGAFYGPGEARRHPEARPTWLHALPPIHYLPHELSPLLYILDDRVVEVTAMSTRSPSYAHPELAQPDMQVALMKTEKDTIVRLAASFAQPHPPRDTHWYGLVGTAGRVEWRRGTRDLPKLWLAGAQMFDLADVDWRRERTDAPPDARGSGHGDADHYVAAAFREAVLHGRPLEPDVYRAVETAAPAILAAESIRQGTRLLPVPDFRPGPGRRPGATPSDAE